MTEWLNLAVLIINTVLTGVLGWAALRLRKPLESISHDVEEMTEK